MRGCIRNYARTTEHGDMFGKGKGTWGLLALVSFQDVHVPKRAHQLGQTAYCETRSISGLWYRGKTGTPPEPTRTVGKLLRAYHTTMTERNPERGQLTPLKRRYATQWLSGKRTRSVRRPHGLCASHIHHRVTIDG
jgi:hypothetical protein